MHQANDFIDYNKIITNSLIKSGGAYKIKNKLRKERRNSLYIMEIHPGNGIAITNKITRQFGISYMAFTSVLGKSRSLENNYKFRSIINSTNSCVLSKRAVTENPEKYASKYDILIIWRENNFEDIEKHYKYISIPGIIIFPIIIKEGELGYNKLILGKLTEKEIEFLQQSVVDHFSNNTVDIKRIVYHEDKKYYSLIFIVT